ncbi:hypothetical protein BCR42DRAFT_491663 [Absidia repens]|uniref:Uncharacterized protein n=1 Tax=Absidia repens TaxID=90262 RepID=A0A1X2IFD6_9FUNG|nr:hypothetical protein BCR42DRAFT_491663 [Absidia repens]
MVDKSRMTLQKLARWHPSQSNTVHDRKGSAALWEGTLQPLDHEDLKQGALYIIKIHHVSVGLFQGWNDDMCCFAVLRSENIPMRWSQARYLPGDYDAYDAFDEAGNPPVHLWTRYLRVEVPINWFAIFEEARRKQRVMMGVTNSGNNGGYPPLVTTLHQQPPQPNILDEDYSEHGTFSAAPSQSLHSDRLSSISSLPLDSRRESMTQAVPTQQQQQQQQQHVDTYSPPQSPTPSNTSFFQNPAFTLPNNTTADDPSDKANTTSALPTTTASTKKKKDADTHSSHHQIQQQHSTSVIASSSSPNVTTASTTTTQELIPAVPSAKTSKRRSTVGATPSQQLELALGDLSFPHDDDRFSIHSDYQPNMDPSSISSTSPVQQHHSHTNTWKKRSIKKMLGRSSTHTK